MKKSTTDIIREDISNTCNERLQNWCSDSLDLYRMGGVRYGVALADLLQMQCVGLAIMAGLCKLTEEELTEIIHHTILHVATKKEESQ